MINHTISQNNRMAMKTYLKTLLFLPFIFFSCAFQEQTKLVEPGSIRATMEWGPAEIRATVDTMVGSLSNFLKEKKKNTAYIELSKIVNRSSEHIDTNQIANEISTDLTKRNIFFVDRSLREDSLKEAKLAMEGVIDRNTAIEPGNIVSPQYILGGMINDNVRYVDGKRVQYITITLKLTEIETTATVWQEEKGFLKETKSKKIGW
jgi:PBP1b-binding outer membrane lipoprotein LpoB